jgi:hypothetical protein
MIAIDTSAFARYLDGVDDTDTRAVEVALETKSGVFPPVVLTELLSNRRMPGSVRAITARVPLLEVHDGYWERAGLLRAALLGGGYKAFLADTLIAQSCIDHDVPLITHDRDFRRFVKAGLKLL